jgi:predicted Zn-dependent protease
MKQVFFIVFIVIFTLKPIVLKGQDSNNPRRDNSLFADMEKIFNGLNEVYTPEDEYYIGRAVAANILAAYKPYTMNPQLTHYLNLICQVLVVNSSMPAIYNGYFVTILNSSELNAFASPGGHIFITKGLIEEVHSEDALAGIIAHELAHIMLRHGMKIINETRFESEIDSMAQRADQKNGLYSTHPAAVDRISNVERQIHAYKLPPNTDSVRIGRFNCFTGRSSD